MRTFAWIVGIGCVALFGCVVVVGSLLAIGAAWAFRPDTTPTPTESFISHGKTIPVERFAPRQPGKYPAVILLHGADGLQVKAWNAMYRGYARQLAEHGYAVFLIHYMDRTGTKFANTREIFREFVPWTETVGDGLTYVSAQPGVDKDRIGVMGLSLGASLALATGAADPRVKTVVEWFGAMPPLAARNLTRMPPVLILHGGHDPLVPVNAAYRLEQLLKDHGLPYEMHVYPGQGHGFMGADGRDAMDRTIAFFDKHLDAAH